MFGNRDKEIQGQKNREPAFYKRWAAEAIATKWGARYSPMTGWDNDNKPTWYSTRYIRQLEPGYAKLKAVIEAVLIWFVAATFGAWLGWTFIGIIALGYAVYRTYRKFKEADSPEKAMARSMFSVIYDISQVIYSFGLLDRKADRHDPHNPWLSPVMAGITLEKVREEDEDMSWDSGIDMLLGIPVPRGKSRDDVLKMSEALKSALRCIRLLPIPKRLSDTSDMVHFKVIYSDNMKSLPASTYDDLIDRQPTFKKIYTGMRDDGKPAYLDTTAHILVGAATGAGKSSWLHTFIVQTRFLGAELHFSDLKFGDGSKSYHARDMVSTASMSLMGCWTQLHYCVQQMNKRYSSLAPIERRMILEGKGEDEIQDTLSAMMDYEPIIMIIDEVGALQESGSGKNAEEIIKKDIKRMLRDITQRGRGAKVIAVLIGQKIKAEIIPTEISANCKSRICMKISDSHTVNLLVTDELLVEQAKAELMSSTAPNGYAYMSVDGIGTSSVMVTWMDEPKGDVRRALQALPKVKRYGLPAHTAAEIAEIIVLRGAQGEVDEFMDVSGSADIEQLDFGFDELLASDEDNSPTPVAMAPATPLPPAPEMASIGSQRVDKPGDGEVVTIKKKTAPVRPQDSELL